MAQVQRASESEEARLTAIVNELAHLLPAQGPIRVFVHHNPLHALEHLPFNEAVREAHALYGARAYMHQTTFLEQYRNGRISERELRRALDKELRGQSRDELCLGLSSRKVRELAVRHYLERPTAAEVTYHIEEGDALTQPRDDAPSLFTRALGPNMDFARELAALWAESKRLAAFTHGASEAAPADTSPRARALKRRARQVDAVVNPLLIRYTAAYLDQGIAYWSMPQRELGFYGAVAALWSRTSSLSTPAIARAAKLLTQLAPTSAAQCLSMCLREFAVATNAEADVLRAMLLALPGWAGMVARLEARPQDRPPGAPPASLLEWLAIRAILELAVVRHLDAEGPAASERRATSEALTVERAFALFNLFQVAGITSERAAHALPSAARLLLDELECFDGLARCAIWQTAYERSYYSDVLDAVGTPRAPAQTGRPSLQAAFCIDDREESFRRHLEEIMPTAETFGIAGFFGLAVDFRGLDDSTHRPLSPPAIVPQHEIDEVARAGHAKLLARRRSVRRGWALLEQAGHTASRSLVRGALVHAVAGLLSGLPLTLRLLAPRHASAVLSWARSALLPKPPTELRTFSEGRASERGKAIGLTVEEQASRIASVLHSSGLSQNLAPLVMLFGHTGSSLNNPHESAYSCGACNGQSGGPNARLFARLANDAQVRAELVRHGIVVPEDTVFIGGLHDTTTDAITLYDRERVPASHREHLEAALRGLAEASRCNAHERCRHFESAPLHLSGRAALRHVENRAHALDEPRPECGHATNASALVGPRWLTRGLFLDRRTLLTSYEPKGDIDGQRLEATLLAVTPVCAGINLEYYFSFVDNDVYGAGTKLPHNVVSDLGVMDGHASDLRTGLPWQMVELHEPVRLLMLVYASRDLLEHVLARQPALRKTYANGWAQLACITPNGMRFIFEQGRFLALPPPLKRLVRVKSSRDYYEGWRDHLRPARIVQEEAHSAR